MNQPLDATSSPASDRQTVRGGNDPLRVRLVSVPSGVAEGRCLQAQGNTRMEWWALFMTREQFDTCAMVDPLRFVDPLLFEQLKTEFDHVFDQPDSLDVYSGTRAKP